jgi:co-chaperonin GroES (HSP10)
MVNNKELAQSISEKITYVPTDDRILVKPLKPVMVSKMLPVAPVKAEGIEEAEKNEVKLEKRKVEANLRRGIVIKLGTDYSDLTIPERLRNIEVGDVVIYPWSAGQSFELFKDSRVLRRYEVVAIEKA